jgi:hypothetical protein
MREIKFRAWHKQDNTMVYFDAEKAANDIYIAQHMLLLMAGKHQQGDGLLQYSGLKINNSELYEDDLISFDWVFQKTGELYTDDSKSMIGVILFHSGKFIVQFCGGAMNFDLSDLNQATFERTWKETYHQSSDYFKMVNFKKIGSIHQNPELLESK